MTIKVKNYDNNGVRVTTDNGVMNKFGYTQWVSKVNSNYEITVFDELTYGIVDHKTRSGYVINLEVTETDYILKVSKKARTRFTVKGLLDSFKKFQANKEYYANECKKNKYRASYATYLFWSTCGNISTKEVNEITGLHDTSEYRKYAEMLGVLDETMKQLGLFGIVNSDLCASDELYTTRKMVEDELPNYDWYFKGKSVLCNCDDSDESEIAKYFKRNFEKLGLKKLVCTCYKNSVRTGETTFTNCYIKYEDGTEERRVLLGDEEEGYENAGSFDSKECIEFLKECDVVVTNPPFKGAGAKYMYKPIGEVFDDLIYQYGKDKISIYPMEALKNQSYYEHLKHTGTHFSYNTKSAIAGWFRVSKYWENQIREQIKTGNKLVRWNEEENCAELSVGFFWVTNIELKDKKYDTKFKGAKYYGNEEKYKVCDGVLYYNGNVKNIPMDYYGEIAVAVTAVNYLDPTIWQEVRFEKGKDKNLVGRTTPSIIVKRIK